ncbi:MAG: hypothetical protein ACM3X9_14410 [Bacillota bacterium]
MFIIGEEVLFKVGLLESEFLKAEIYLKYMGVESDTLRFKGYLPRFWQVREGSVQGPLLFYKSVAFKPIRIDYQQNKIWISELAECLKKIPEAEWSGELTPEDLDLERVTG